MKQLWIAMCVVLAAVAMSAFGCGGSTARNEAVEGDARPVYQVAFADAAPEVDGVASDPAWQSAPEVVLPDLEGRGRPTAFKLLHTEDEVFGFISCTDSDLVPVDFEGNRDKGDKVTIFFQNPGRKTVWLTFTVDRSFASMNDLRTPSTELVTIPLTDEEFSAATMPTNDGWAIEFRFLKSALADDVGELDQARFYLSRMNARTLRDQDVCARTDAQVRFVPTIWTAADEFKWGRAVIRAGMTKEEILEEIGKSGLDNWNGNFGIQEPPPEMLEKDVWQLSWGNGSGVAPAGGTVRLTFRDGEVVKIEWYESRARAQMKTDPAVDEEEAPPADVVQTEPVVETEMPSPGVEGVTIENGFVTSIGDTRLATPMLPGRNDREVATALDGGVREAGLSYLRKRRGHERFTLTDAHRVGDFFLLWYAAQDVEDDYENFGLFREGKEDSRPIPRLYRGISQRTGRSGDAVRRAGNC